MKTYAVYRPLYGEDFIEESILSILDYVDRVFFCYTDTPLCGVTSVVYRGRRVEFPLRPGKTMDSALERVQLIASPKIEILYQLGHDNMNQFTRLVNEMVLPHYDKPDIVFLIEPDHVFKRSEIEKALDCFSRASVACATTTQVELWKTPDWAIPIRPRASTVFWNMKGMSRIPPTMRQAEPASRELPCMQAVTHNFGFCVSPKSMYWKHLLAIAFSTPLGDSVPDENWLDEKWLTWDPLENNANLEIAKGYGHLIPRAVPYTPSNLPELICERYGYDRNRGDGCRLRETNTGRKGTDSVGIR